MKTTIIDMSKAKGNNVFTNAVWKEANNKEILKVNKIILKIKNV